MGISPHSRNPGVPGATGHNICYWILSDHRHVARAEEIPFDRDAEGATRPETLRQKDCIRSSALESGQHSGPPKGKVAYRH